MTTTMYRRSLLIAAACFVACILIAHAGGAAKVQICHVPPGDPSNFHTITVSEKALTSHLKHGDLAGSCFENCEVLCDDGNACTIDACDPETEACLPDHPPVDCDDTEPCTVDSCDPQNGCVNTLLACDDSNACTTDVCADGSCVNANIDCGPSSFCEPALGCQYPCDGFDCPPQDICHGAGECFVNAQNDPECDYSQADDFGTAFGGYCYTFHPEWLDFDAAEQACALEQPGGHLASIHSDAENAFISGLVDPTNQGGITAYIGGERSGACTNGVGWEGGWTDGTPWDYQNWRASTGEPNGCNNSWRHCTQFWPTNPANDNCPDLTVSCSGWNDVGCAGLSYVCKFPPPGSTP